MLGKEPEEKSIEEAYHMLQKSINLLESHFLKDMPFINSSEISIADIQAACEFSQFYMADIDMLKDNPQLNEWMERCKDKLSPKFDAVHAMVYLAREKGAFKNL